jgi:hypothetical protein
VWNKTSVSVPVSIEMDPLSRVEEYLSAVESWPTYIIQQMNVEEPSDRSVREVAEFMCCIELSECLVHMFNCNVHSHMLFY